MNRRTVLVLSGILGTAAGLLLAQPQTASPARAKQPVATRAAPRRDPVPAPALKIIDAMDVAGNQHGFAVSAIQSMHAAGADVTVIVLKADAYPINQVRIAKPYPESMAWWAAQLGASVETLATGGIVP